MIKKLTIGDFACKNKFSSENIDKLIRVGNILRVYKEDNKYERKQVKKWRNSFDKLIDIMKHMGKLALITVIFKNYTILDDFFASLAKQTDTEFHVYAIDLTPNPQDYTYPSYVTYLHDKNGGYAYGINQGVKKALQEGYDLVAPMNCDVTVQNDFVTAIKKSLEQNPRAIVGAKIYYYPGFEYHAHRYTKDQKGRVFWYAGGVTDWQNVYTTHRGVDEVDQGQYDTQEKTTFITGCFMAYTKFVVASVGFWDEDYFLFYEDADFCARAMRKSIPLLYDPSIVIWHKSGQSTSGAASAFQQRYLEKNRLVFGLRFAPWRTKLHLIKNYFLEKLSNNR
jgi:hypothetical protein